jgi:hypothetical protein
MKTRIKSLVIVAFIALVGLIPLAPAQAGSFTDYFENKLVDLLIRGQAYSPPATLYVGLLTAACSDSSPGTEVSTSGTAYARVAVTSNMTNWAGTQSAGSTTASSGTSGTTSNNGSITFPAPVGSNWGVITHFAVYDLSSAGNMLVCQSLTTPKTVNAGDAAPSFAAGALTIQVDN